MIYMTRDMQVLLFKEPVCYHEIISSLAEWVFININQVQLSTEVYTIYLFRVGLWKNMHFLFLRIDKIHDY